MIKQLSFLSAFILLNINSIHSQNEARLSINRQIDGSYVFVTQQQFHLRYGLAFPLTFKFYFSPEVTGLNAKVKHSSTDSWETIPEKHPGDIYNDEEAVRFDYNEQYAFISASFNYCDSLFIKICDDADNNIESNYEGITKYYDNRQAAVTITADDWLNGYNDLFPPLLNIFRSYGLYVTVGITTKYLGSSVWDEIQNQLNLGSIEVASHSRTHPFIPYSDPYGEVLGSVTDIKRNLKLPKYFNANNEEYVYVWIAPSGEYDATIDSLLGLSTYLAVRLYENLPTDTPRAYIYGDSTFSSWNSDKNHFEPFLPTVEIGAPEWGGGDTSLSTLNDLYDTVIVKGGIYHLMWHPQVIFDDQDKDYLLNHLSYISFHSDLWYVNLGPLYLYHIIYEANSPAVTDAHEPVIKPSPGSYKLEQNYPNPFNPYTTIHFELKENVFVNVTIYSMLGERIAALVNDYMEKGVHEINFDTAGLSSGSYIYQLKAGKEVFTKKMTLLK